VYLLWYGRDIRDMFMALEVTMGDFHLHCLSHKTYQVQAYLSYFIVRKLEVFIRFHESVASQYYRAEYKH
jgi:hypothetical protein